MIFNMKKLFTAVFMLITIAANAQQNTLLSNSFWQDAPDLNAVKAEVAKGNSASQANAMSMDPVVMAINAQSSAEIIKYLLDQPGIDVNKLTHDDRNYLHWAAMRGNTEVMEYLIGKGAKTDMQDSHGTTPFTFAASGGQQNTKVYDILLSHGINLKKELNADGANALLLAVANDKNLKLTDYFISKGLDLKSTDADGNNAFAYAAKSGNTELLKMLVQKGVLVNQNAMLMAAQSGGRRGPGGGGPGGGPAAGGNNLAIYQYLEGLGVKPTAVSNSGQNALHYIVRKPNQAEVIKYFLAKGVDVNQADEDGNTVLMNAAASSRDTAIIAMLLPKVKNINQNNHQGNSALTMAVRSNSPEMVRFLLAKNADVKVLDNKGNNLAYYLIASYSPAGERQFNGAKPEDFDAKLKILSDKGLNVAAPQKDGNTLYHLAIAKNDVALLQKIQPLAIDINAKNKEGLTALHKAALIAKNDVLMKYLVSIGAKTNIGTNFNETAFDLASENESLSKNKISVTFLK